MSSQLFYMFTQLMTIQLTECSETSAHKIQMPGNHQKERIQYYTLNFTVFFCVGCDKGLNRLMENYWRKWKAYRLYKEATEVTCVLEVMHTCYM